MSRFCYYHSIVKEEKKQNREDESETTLYELGFHIVPTVAEEAVSDEIAAVKKEIASHKGELVSEGGPVFIELAYPMDKSVSNKKQSYDTAYFAWIIFRGYSSRMDAFKEWLDAHPSILRHLLVKTNKEDASGLRIYGVKSGNREEDERESGQPEEAPEGARAESVKEAV